MLFNLFYFILFFKEDFCIFIFKFLGIIDK